MKISTKGRYGLRAMIDLAAHSSGEYISLKSIAERQKISLNYLEHSFSALKKAGIVAGLAGSSGGYRLNHDPCSITVQTILYVLEGDLCIVDKPSAKNETSLQRCIRMNVWDRIDEDIKDIIATATLQDMVDGWNL